MKDSTLLSWLRQQQTPPGWYDLVVLMVENMVGNVGEYGCERFLRETGYSLACRFPLAPSATPLELEKNINARLSEFHWGFVTVCVEDTRLVFHHRALPPSRDKGAGDVWQDAFCTVLEGVYSCWMREQGGDVRLVFRREMTDDDTEAKFSYSL